MGKKILTVLVIALIGYWAFSQPAEAAGVVESLAGALQEGIARIADFISNL